MIEQSGRLLAGHPIYVDDLPIYSPKLDEIILISEEKYNLYIYLCILENLNIPLHHDNKYDNLINQSDDFYNYFYSALEFMTGQIFKRVDLEDDVIFFSNTSVLHRHNFDKFTEYIKLANGIDINESKVSRNHELDKRIEEAKRRVYQRINKPTDSKENITLIDLVSVLASKHNNLNIMNIWNLNLFQFNNQFKRMRLIENYDIGVRSLLAGASKKDVKLEDYAKKI